MSERRLMFDEWLVKTCLVVCSALFLTAALSFAGETTVDPIGIGKRAESLGIIGILAAVIVILVVALVMVYRGKEAAAMRREERLERLIEQTSTAIAGDAETRRDTNNILVEFKAVIDKCRKNGG